MLDLFNIISRVLQSFHLVSLLFILFINDLHFLNWRKLLFADDMKLF
jgi:hypothetical protein